MSNTEDHGRIQQDITAQAALPQLSVLADKLDALTVKVFAKHISHDPSDGASVMALSFVTKQREHLRSVRLLIDEQQHRDALLIARTMVEGLGRLLWAFHLQPQKTDLWFWFGAILDWRQIKKNEASGIPVDSDEKAELRAYIDKYGPNYYQPHVRKSVEAAQRDGTEYEIPEDPWRTNWTDTSVQTMFDEVGGKFLYDRVYRESSEWIHWGPRAMLRAMQFTDWGVEGFAEVDWLAASRALQLGCQSLLQSLEVLDAHFSLGITERLAELNQEMTTILDEAMAVGRTRRDE